MARAARGKGGSRGTSEPQEELREVVQEIRTQLRVATYVFPVIGSIVLFFVGWLLYVPIREIYGHSQSIGTLAGKIDGVEKLQEEMKSVAQTLSEESKKISKIEVYGDKFDKMHQDFLASKLSYEATEKSFKNAISEVGEFAKVAADLNSRLNTNKEISERAISKAEDLTRQMDAVTKRLEGAEVSVPKGGTLVAMKLPVENAEDHKDHLLFTYSDKFPTGLNYGTTELRMIDLVGVDDGVLLTLTATVSNNGEIQVRVTGSEGALKKLGAKVESGPQPYFHVEMSVH